MDKEFLTNIGISDENADIILEKAQSDMSRLQISHAVKSELLSNGVKNIDAAMKLFDTEGLSVQDTEVVGLGEKVKAFILENDFLFENPSKPIFSAPSGDSGQKNISREEFSKMGYAKRLKLYNENPDAYNELAGKE